MCDSLSIAFEGLSPACGAAREPGYLEVPSGEYLLSRYTIFVMRRRPLVLFTLVALLAVNARTQPVPQRDGQHDFDFEIGTWSTHVRRLLRPLTGSKSWVEMNGTTVVRKVWNGRSNIVELEADSPTGHFEGLSLRLYNPQTHQWSIHYANSRDGMLDRPTIGQFKDGRGEFFSQETLEGRTIFVRFVIVPSGPDSCQFEQAFSEDGGRTWETNWIATDTRVKE